MKDFKKDTTKYKPENQDLKCPDAIRGRMMEDLKRTKAKISRADRKRIKPCIFELRR